MSQAKSRLQLLYEQHADELDAFARRRVGRDESRDVVHDAYLRLAAYADPAALDNPRAYLYRLTGNVANDYGTRSLLRSEWTEPDADLDAAACPKPGPERRAESRDALSRCLAALDELPETYRHVFLLHRVDGMAQGDIAAALGIPLRSVERYIAKALAHCLKRQ
ncbi:MAG: RNA polymerase sigma factor [Rhodocyclaceae bacterium]|nr:RNA polymerase sigma factor [Rhodocyclaceae bacterium]